MTRGFRDEDRDESVTLHNVKCLRDSGKALLCRIDGAETWIPQSVITDDSEVFEAGGEGKLVIAAWFARKEGLGGE